MNSVRSDKTKLGQRVIGRCGCVIERIGKSGTEPSYRILYACPLPAWSTGKTDGERCEFTRSEHEKGYGWIEGRALLTDDPLRIALTFFNE